MTAILYRQLVVPVFNTAQVKRVVASAGAAYKRWSAARESARRDAEFWALAQTDHRVMADLRCAMCAQDREQG